MVVVFWSNITAMWTVIKYNWSDCDLDLVISPRRLRRLGHVLAYMLTEKRGEHLLCWVGMKDRNSSIRTLQTPAVLLWFCSSQKRWDEEAHSVSVAGCLFLHGCQKRSSGCCFWRTSSVMMLLEVKSDLLMVLTCGGRSVRKCESHGLSGWTVGIWLSRRRCLWRRVSERPGGSRDCKGVE